MLRVGVIDYGAGNIASVLKAIDYAGGEPELVSDADALGEYDKLVLPGVGATQNAINNLKAKNFDEALKQAVFEDAKSLMGICVGMQMMAEDMYEFGHHKGLGWFKGRVISLEEHGVKQHVVPHMGWNDTRFSEGFQDIKARLGRHSAFYYCHSFTLVPDDKSIITSTADYEVEIVSGIAKDNICGFQFHPEKSQLAGDLLLQWFVDWEP